MDDCTDNVITFPKVKKPQLNPSLINALRAQMPPASFKCNPSATIQDAQDCTIQGLPFSASPDANNDRVLVYNAGTGVLYTTSPGNLAAGGTAGVTSLGGLTGIVGLATGLKITGSNLDLNLGNGLSTSGGSLAASLGAGFVFSGADIGWTASTAPYTSARTGGVSQTVQSRFDSGVLYSSDFGTVCNGSNNDASAMENFLAAVAASPSKIGIVTGTSTAAVCNMSSSAFQIRGGTTIMCSQGVILKFNRASSLVIPYNALAARSYQGKFIGCYIDGQSVVGSVGVDLYDASEWVVRDTYVNNVDVGFAFDGAIASYYNRLYNIRVNSARTYGIFISGVGNSNSVQGFRLSGLPSYGIGCLGGNQNTFYGGSIGNGFVAAITAQNNCWGSVFSGIRMEEGTTGLSMESGANYNTYGGLFCDGLTGSPVVNNGTGNVKFGASNC